MLTFPPGVDRATFLHEYWQKRPLLMRAALPPAAFTLAADELAGLACEPEFESRLIIQHDTASWEVRHGPFSDQDFALLPLTRWTLLVQDVDKYLRDVARLIEAFDFVPSWRIDDIMVSYASDRGGVGPHDDDYDVFLMQAMGRRHWRLSYREYHDDDLLPGLEQRVLSFFDSDEEWLVEPGDVLYLPPGVAHWGVAEGECMTYSLGFRSPSQQDLASDWFQHLVALTGAQRLQDPEDLRADDLAQLTAGVCDNAASLLQDLPTTRSREFQLWLGQYLTEPKPQFQILPPDQPWTMAGLDDWLLQGGAISRHPFARISWTAPSANESVLFYQGTHISLPSSMQHAVSRIAVKRRFHAAELVALGETSPGVYPLLLRLLNEGILEPDEGLP